HGFVGYPFDYRVTLGFGSIAGGLDLVNPVIRLPLEHGISRDLNATSDGEIVDLGNYLLCVSFMDLGEHLWFCHLFWNTGIDNDCIVRMIQPQSEVYAEMVFEMQQLEVLLEMVLALGGHLEDVETAVEIIARPCDLSSDRVEDLTTASGRNRLKSVLEDSTW
ncbi:hypothetical protein Tco_1045795, partial [Tanacetum coccineum]